MVDRTNGSDPTDYFRNSMERNAKVTSLDGDDVAEIMKYLRDKARSRKTWRRKA